MLALKAVFPTPHSSLQGVGSITVKTLNLLSLWLVTNVARIFNAVAPELLIFYVNNSLGKLLITTVKPKVDPRIDWIFT